MKDNKQQEEFARNDAILAICGCILGVIAFIVILLFGIF